MKTKNTKKIIGSLLATSAAVIFATAPVTSSLVHAKENKLLCYGINSCKGKSVCCKTAKNTCKGRNQCKGQGYSWKTADECKKLGGKPFNYKK